MKKSPFVWRTSIRFIDTDTSGRIHFTSLFRYFESAEEEFLNSIGCHYLDLEEEEKDVTFPRVHVECDYLGQLRFHDEIDIAVSVEKVGSSSFTLLFDVKRQNEHVASGKITGVAMSRTSQKAAKLPGRFAAALREHLKGAKA